MHLQWLREISAGFKRNFFVLLLLSTLSVFFSLAFVAITKILIDGEIKVMQKIGLLVFLLILTKLLQLFCEQSEMFLREITSSKLENYLSLKIFTSLFDSKITDEQSMHSGDEMNRLTTDVRVVTQYVTYSIPTIIYSSVQLIATCCYLLTIEPILTVVAASTMPIAIFIGHHYTKRMIPISKEIRSSDSKVNEFMQEHLQHHELISTLGQNAFVKNQLQSLLTILLKKIKARIYLDISAGSLVEIGFAVGFLSVFVWAVYGIKNDTFTYAQLIVFMQLLGQLQRPFIMFKEQYPSFITSFASVERLLEIERMPKEEIGSSLILEGAIGVKFKKVSFRYSASSRWIYKDFNYDFKQGSISAIVGETGAGKSTLLRMILAILSPVSGTITLYGNNADKYTICDVSSLTRCNCIYVPQSNSIISGSIRYNLFLGNIEASEKEMRNALYFAAAEFVFKDFPDGLDTVVGEGGLGISEGQAQRIAIARSFLRPGGLILMDEPTSALDADTEKLFLTRLASKTNEKTIIIITHKQEICNYVSNTVTIDFLRA